MELRPILSALGHHRIAAALIVLEIALSCAIICNALAVVQQRWVALHQPSGIDETRLLRINLAGVAVDSNADARSHEDLALLRALPGVAAASIVNQLPFSRQGQYSASLATRPDQADPTIQAASMYMGCADLVSTLGLRLIAGRNLLEQECKNYSAIERGEVAMDKLRLSVLLNARTAQALFGKTNPLGRKIYAGPMPFTVVGVIAELAPAGRGDGLGYAIVLPLRLNYSNDGSYVLRVTDPDRRENVLDAATHALLGSDDSRLLLEHERYSDMRASFFSRDRDMIALLLAVCTLLLIVTALGIVGLASFWVQQRTKQIGIRRALGASRGQILRYFQTENLLLTSIGIVLGMLLAYALNLLLMSKYELPRLSLIYLPIGAGLLWLLGQLAVLWPARRAAAVAPAVATRTV